MRDDESRVEERAGYDVNPGWRERYDNAMAMLDDNIARIKKLNDAILAVNRSEEIEINPS